MVTTPTTIKHMVTTKDIFVPPAAKCVTTIYSSAFKVTTTTYRPVYVFHDASAWTLRMWGWGGEGTKQPQI